MLDLNTEDGKIDLTDKDYRNPSPPRSDRLKAEGHPVPSTQKNQLSASHNKVRGGSPPISVGPVRSGHGRKRPRKVVGQVLGFLIHQRALARVSRTVSRSTQCFGEKEGLVDQLLLGILLHHPAEKHRAIKSEERSQTTVTSGQHVPRSPSSVL